MKYALFTLALILNTGSAFAAGDAEAKASSLRRPAAAATVSVRAHAEALARNSMASSAVLRGPPPTISIPTR